MEPPWLKRSSRITASLPDLREEVAVEVREPAGEGVGDVDVGHAAARHLVHAAAVVLHPGAQAQRRLGGDRHHRDLARARAVGGRTDGEHGLLTRGALEQAEHVVVAAQVLPVHGEQELAGLHVHAGLGERRLQLGVPVLAGQDPLELIAPRRHAIVGAEQADADRLLLRLRAALDEGVARSSGSPSSRGTACSGLRGWRSLRRRARRGAPPPRGRGRGSSGA